MKTLQNIAKVLVVVLLSYNSTFGCSCSQYEPVFCRNVHEGHNIVSGVVTNKPDFHLLEIDLLENIYKEIVEDTLLVLGQDGINCGQSLNQFEVGDTLVLALSYGQFDEGALWYLDGYCGLHFLRFEDGLIKGRITDTLTSQTIQSFKDNLMSCIDLGVSLEELASDEAQLSLYPNPVSDFFQVLTFNTQISAYEIYDSKGAKVESKVLSKLADKIEVCSSDLTKGVYFIVIRTSKGILTRTFLQDIN